MAEADLAVVGGGPAGLATALHARRHGLTVTVLDPRDGGEIAPGAEVDKACGEGLMPGGLARLRALGIDVEGQPLRGIRYLTADGSLAANAPLDPPGLGVRRTRLRSALRAAAVEAGVQLQPVRVTADDLRPDSSGRYRLGPVRARWVIGADGLHSTVRRIVVGADQHRPTWPPLPRRHGLVTHAAVEPWSDHVEVYWGAQAELYVTPVGERCVGVAALSSRRRPLAGHLAETPALAERLRVAAPDLTTLPVRGAGPLHQPVRRRTRDRLLLVGDAAGYVDAITGEGLSLALAEAEAAVDAIVADDPAGYERRWRGITRGYRARTAALVLGTSVPLLRRSLVPAAMAMPGVFSGAVRAVGGGSGRGGPAAVGGSA